MSPAEQTELLERFGTRYVLQEKLTKWLSQSTRRLFGLIAHPRQLLNAGTCCPVSPNASALEHRLSYSHGWVFGIEEEPRWMSLEDALREAKANGVDILLVHHEWEPALVVNHDGDTWLCGA